MFSYYFATLQAEIRAAKAEGSYSEGVSDIPASGITRAAPPAVFYTDPITGLHTTRHDLQVGAGSLHRRVGRH